MSLAGIEKNKKIAQQLSGLIRSGRSVHAFLFSGGSREDRASIGNEFAKALLCSSALGDSCGMCSSCRAFDSGNNADFIAVEPLEGRASIGVDSIAELQKKLLYKPVGRGYVAVIYDAELMTSAAQNKLLKTLEEPSGDVVMILLSERRDAMLSTVLSRCSAYELGEAESEADPAVAKAAGALLDAFEKDAPYYRKKECIADILDNKENAREAALMFLDAFEDFAAEAVRSGASQAAAVSAELAETARRQIKQGHSVPYTLKQMCLGMRARR